MENESSSDATGDEKPTVEVETANIPEENDVNASNVSVEVIKLNNTGESETVEYQEAPSASAVPVPTFTPQQPLAVPAPGIAAHSAPQNLKTLPQGKIYYRKKNLTQISLFLLKKLISFSSDICNDILTSIMSNDITLLPILWAFDDRFNTIISSQ